MLTLTKSNQFLKELSESERQDMKLKIADHVSEILTLLGIDHSEDHNTKDTPKRLAKLWVDEACRGRFTACPTITSFPAEEATDQLVVVKNIDLRSMCSHHFVPIIGKVHVGYLANERVIGLSKFGRLVEWYAQRPQIQEEFTQQLFDHLQELLEPKALIVWVDAVHMCMSWRGIKNSNSSTVTSACCEMFKTNFSLKEEFLASISS